MELKLLTDQQFELVYHRDLCSAFPQEELRPLKALRSLLESGRYTPWALFNGSEIVATCFLCSAAPGWSLLDYLCVSSSHRGRGYGSCLLQKVIAAKKETILFAECEAPQYAHDPIAATRRIAFYLHNGGQLADYQAELFGVRYQVVCLTAGNFSNAALQKAHRDAYRSCFTDENFKNHVHIPCDPSKLPSKKVSWKE